MKNYKIILEEGGSRSSKTFSIFQIWMNKALEGVPFTLTIARDKLTWIKTTLLKDFEEIAEMYGDAIEIYPRINPNRSEQIYRVNGSEFAFFGLDYPQKLHGRKQDWFWFNEVMEIQKKSFDQVEMRTTKGGIIDYNPTDDTHWVFDLQKRNDVTTIKSTMLDNPFNPQTVIDKILSYEPTPHNIEQGTADAYLWSVYGLGERARLEGVVFTNWDIVDSVPEDANFMGNGMDFGYSVHPSALIRMHMYNNEIYFDELFYEVGLVNSSPNLADDTIVKRLTRLEIGSELIVADSAEPKSIQEIRYHHFNIKGVQKGPDSINFGIDLMKGYKIHITRRSINLQKEFSRYKWATDKDGKPFNPARPIDDFNHAIDAARYISMTVLKKKIEVQIYDANEFGL